eukprot:TRINITY_DN15508_c0_g2_i1.p1 TRINITY_DN15508_c0_g2~~TRINITY_DN15508_c0_g2_i1.p1  ORF type:complete len:138 (+),score=30.60 TRINITY_DN15508_c0_g2_i1:98-511(+)
MTWELVGRKAPDFEFTLVDNTKTRFADVVGERKPVVVLIYCNFCPACGPVADQFEEKCQSEQYVGKVNFLLVNLQGVEQARSYAMTRSLKNCPHAGADASGAFAVERIPHLVLIGPDGVIQRNGDDFEWSDLDGFVR